MNKITVSAPGKLMLLGEYAVLDSRPCLVTAVDKRMRVTVELIDREEFLLDAADVGLSGYRKPINMVGEGDIPKEAKFVEMAVKNALRHSGVALLPRMTVGVSVATKSDFSSQFGFGSSSAVTVCVIRAMSELFNLKLSKKEIFDLSYKTVLDIQKRGSGFDIAAAVYGGTLYFLTGGKLIESLDIKSLPLVVGYSGIKADTAKLINKVKKDFSNKRNHLDKIYNGIEVLVNQGKETLIKSDWKRLGKLLNKNQDYLRELGVGTRELDIMIDASISAGSYGAKLSGAGGGDCMIAVVGDKKRKKIEEAISKAGGEVVDVKTNAEGVRIE